MDDVRLQQLLQEAEEHLRARSCRQRYERAVVRLPDSRRASGSVMTSVRPKAHR